MMPGVVAGFPRKTAVVPVGGTFSLTAGTLNQTLLNYAGFSAINATPYGSISPAQFNVVTGAGGAIADGTVLELAWSRNNSSPFSSAYRMVLQGEYPTIASLPMTKVVYRTKTWLVSSLSESRISVSGGRTRVTLELGSDLPNVFTGTANVVVTPNVP